MTSSDHVLSERFEITGRDFSKAGSISTSIKEILQEIGIAPSIIRRAAIASYEAEMNIVMYANKGTITLNITPEKLHLNLEDKGPGIMDIEMAMQEGFSTATDKMREMGFGAGMGLPNIKKNADRFTIASIPGEGTNLDIIFCLNATEKQ
jgi:serine/threonine-protein kinase RsbT